MNFIPTNDLSEFSALPDEARAEILSWLRSLAALQVAGRDGIRKEVEKQANEMGVSVATVRRHLTNYRKSGDWRVLLNRAKYPPNASFLSGKFLAFWKSLLEKNPRSSRAAHRELMGVYHSRKRIPGYSVKPPLNSFGVPNGWSYRNLIRCQTLSWKLTH